MLSNVKNQEQAVALLSRVISGETRQTPLLVGPSGIGKKFAILEAACVMVSDPTQEYQVRLGIHPDIIVISPEGPQLKVDQVRSVLGELKYLPNRAPFKYLVVDGIDKSTAATANALLKALEDTPKHVRFFLTAEVESDVIPTIRSRCATVPCLKLPLSTIEDWFLAQTGSLTPLMKTCSRIADGSLGEAQALHLEGLTLRNTAFETLQAIAKGDLVTSFGLVSKDLDYPRYLRFLEAILCDLTLINFNSSRVLNVDLLAELEAVRCILSVNKLEKLRRGLQEIQAIPLLSLNIQFHIKTLLSSVI
jgi:DNA polymerase-3 subunit delta'